MPTQIAYQRPNHGHQSLCDQRLARHQYGTKLLSSVQLRKDPLSVELTLFHYWPSLLTPKSQICQYFGQDWLQIQGHHGQLKGKLHLHLLVQPFGMDAVQRDVQLRMLQCHIPVLLLHE